MLKKLFKKKNVTTKTISPLLQHYISQDTDYYSEYVTYLRNKDIKYTLTGILQRYLLMDYLGDNDNRVNKGSNFSSLTIFHYQESYIFVCDCVEYRIKATDYRVDFIASLLEENKELHLRQYTYAQRVIAILKKIC